MWLAVLAACHAESLTSAASLPVLAARRLVMSLCLEKGTCFVSPTLARYVSNRATLSCKLHFLSPIPDIYIFDSVMITLDCSHDLGSTPGCGMQADHCDKTEEGQDSRPARVHDMNRLHDNACSIVEGMCILLCNPYRKDILGS